MGEAELRHEARAALLGVEAAASGLTQHRLLTAEQIDELSQGLVAEVRRLLALLDGRIREPETFDLHDAIAPVLTCARAEGLDVRSTVPRGIEVAGSADSTAQVLLALLTNAQRHAPGSPVEVRAIDSRRRRCLCRGPRAGSPRVAPGASVRAAHAKRSAATGRASACSSLGG